MSAQVKDKRKEIRKIYALLGGYFGDLGWWPADSGFEVIVGAVLTQNTSWSNVEKVISKLKSEGLLDPSNILKIDKRRLSGLVRSAGYFRVKSQRLKDICHFLIAECGGDLHELKKLGISQLRKKLLEVKGIGPETADAILVYALDKPVFVVDAYTKRIFFRHGLVQNNSKYDDIQSLVRDYFPEKVKALNQFHALLVETGKQFCKKNKPLCKKCPLGVLLGPGG